MSLLYVVVLAVIVVVLLAVALYRPSHVNIKADYLVAGRSQRHRAEQARLQQRRIGVILTPGREGQPAGGAGLAIEQPLRPRRESLPVPATVAIRRQLLVTDEPVRPEVRDFDDQLVCADRK